MFINELFMIKIEDYQNFVNFVSYVRNLEMFSMH